MKTKFIFIFYLLLFNVPLYAGSGETSGSFANVNAVVDFYYINKVRADHQHSICIDNNAEIQYIISSQKKEDNPLLDGSSLNIEKIEVMINDESVFTDKPAINVYYGTDELHFITIDKTVLEKYDGQNVSLKLNIAAREEDADKKIIAPVSEFGAKYNNIFISFANNFCNNQ